VALRLWNQLLRQWSVSDNLIRGLAQRGKLRVGTAPMARFGNGSGNGEKCSWGCSGAPICRPKSPTRAEHRPGDPLQLNRRFVTCLDFVVAMRGKETGRWGGVRGRHERTPARLGSGLASLHAARTGTGWLGCTASAGPRESGRWLLGQARLSARFRPTANVNIENSFSFSKSVYNLQTNLNSIQI
jgi:hypothetical protein